MTDIFADAHKKANEQAIRKQSADHEEALKELTKRKAAQRLEAAKRNPNADVGYTMKPKFYEPGA